MLSTVIGEIDIIKTFVLFSDKCQLKEIYKLESDYAKDLINCRYATKARLEKYLKGPTSKSIET